MKIVLSLGGPLVGVDRAFMNLWCGAEGHAFIGTDTCDANDYNAAGALTGGVDHPPYNISMLTGVSGIALLISLPFETAVVYASDTFAYLAQIEYGESDWSFDLLDPKRLSSLTFVENISFDFSGDELVFFDASYAARDVDDDLLSLRLRPGKYNFAATPFQYDINTSLIIFKIERS